MNRVELFTAADKARPDSCSFNLVDPCNKQAQVIKVGKKDFLTEQEQTDLRDAKLASAPEKWRDQPAEVQQYYLDRVTEKLNPWKMSSQEKRETYSKFIEQADSFLSKADQEFLTSFEKLKKAYKPIAQSIENFKDDVRFELKDIMQRIKDIPLEDRQQLTDMLSPNELLSDLNREPSPQFLKELHKFHMDKGGNKLLSLYGDSMVLRGRFKQVSDAFTSQSDFVASARATVSYVHHLSGDVGHAKALEEEKEIIRNTWQPHNMKEILESERPYATSVKPYGSENVYLWDKKN